MSYSANLNTCSKITTSAGRLLPQILICLLLLLAPAAAQLPPTFNIQLNIADAAGQPISGTVALTVKVYDAERGGTMLFQNDVADRYITAAEGYANYYVKNAHGIDFAKELWAELAINGTTLPTRVKLTPTPQALFANRAGTADFVNVADSARNVFANSINTNSIADGTVTGADIAAKTITPNNIITDGPFNWTATHNWQTTTTNLTLATNTNAIDITKGHTNLQTLTATTINTPKFAATDATITNAQIGNATANSLTLQNFRLSTGTNQLTLIDTTTTNGIMMESSVLNYTAQPDNSTLKALSIAPKAYIDAADSTLTTQLNSMQNNVVALLPPLAANIDSAHRRIDTSNANISQITARLTNGHLVQFDGYQLQPTVAKEQNGLLTLSNNSTYTQSDSLALVTKRYTDGRITAKVDSALTHIDSGIYASLASGQVPKWDASRHVFVASNIFERPDTTTIGQARFVIENLPLSTSLEGLNHITAASLWVSNIWAKGIATDIAEYAQVDDLTGLPPNANRTTLAPVAFVTKVADSLASRIETDPIDGRRLLDNSVFDAKITDLNGQKLHNYSVTGGYNGALAMNTVADENLRPGSIRDSHIVSNAITERHIAPSAVTNSKLYVNNIMYSGNDGQPNFMPPTPSERSLTTKAYVDAVAQGLANAELDGARLKPGSISSDKIGFGQVKSYNIAAAAVTDDKLDAVNIQYLRNTPELQYMPIAAAAATLTTKAYVDKSLSDAMLAEIAGGRLMAGSVGSRELTDGGIQTEDLADGAINYQKIAVGAVMNRHIRVSSIVYSDNLLDSNYMPGTATDSTLATAGYVKSIVANSRAIVAGDGTEPALSIANPAPGGVALELRGGSLVLSFVDINNPVNNPDLPAGYVVYNLHNAIGGSTDININLPEPTAPGQTIYISNNTLLPLTPRFGGNVVDAIGSIAIDAVGQFISLPNHKDSGQLTWRRAR